MILLKCFILLIMIGVVAGGITFYSYVKKHKLGSLNSNVVKTEKTTKTIIQNK